MCPQVSRRYVLRSAVLAPALALFADASFAADLEPLEESDPSAKSFSFVTDASKLAPNVTPVFKAGQRCASCALYLGKPADAVAGCAIFAGRSVPAAGWCKVWAARGG